MFIHNYLGKQHIHQKTQIIDSELSVKTIIKLNSGISLFEWKRSVVEISSYIISFSVKEIHWIKLEN